MDYEERINQCQFITAKGETLYLRNGILSRHTINFPGSNEYEYLFTQIWVSISHTEIPKTFDSISVKFSGLKENINHIPFDIKRDQTNNEYTISIDKANLKKEIISLNEVRLSSACKINRKRTRFNEITFQYENSLKFEYKTI